jgi:formylmethanofuran dehydrogenase subunit E
MINEKVVCNSCGAKVKPSFIFDYQGEEMCGNCAESLADERYQLDIQKQQRINRWE